MAGYSLNDVGSRLDLYQLWCLVKGFLRRESSLLFETAHGVPVAKWTLTNDLIAHLSDQVNMLAWQLGGGKGSRPKPIERPSTQGDVRRFGFEPIPMNEFNDWWNSN